MHDLENFRRAGPFSHTQEPSIAEIALCSMLRVLRGGPTPDCPQAIEERPILAGFLDRVEKSDQVRRNLWARGRPSRECLRSPRALLIGIAPGCRRRRKSGSIKGEGRLHPRECEPAHPDAVDRMPRPVPFSFGAGSGELERNYLLK